MEQGREIRALVTGAAGGMGRATCLELLRDTRRRGQTLRLAAADVRPAAALDDLVAELRAAGASASAHVADLSDPAASPAWATRPPPHVAAWTCCSPLPA